MRSPLARLAIFVCAVLLACGNTEKVLETDKPLMVTIEDMERYGYQLDHLAHLQEFSRVRAIDGSLAIKYRFVTPDTSEQRLFLLAGAVYERNEREAIVTYRMNKDSVSVSSGTSGVSMREEPGFYRWGDESYFGFFVAKDGKPGGNAFVTRQGNRVYLLVITGIVFDNPDEWAEFIAPQLEYLESYDPTKAKS